MTPLRLIALGLGLLLHGAALVALLLDYGLGWALAAHLLGALAWGYGAAGLLPGHSKPMDGCSRLRPSFSRCSVRSPLSR